MRSYGNWKKNEADGDALVLIHEKKLLGDYSSKNNSDSFPEFLSHHAPAYGLQE
jgi:hypothetical protein